MRKYNNICEHLQKKPKTWLITGVAGFIGSNLLQKLLEINQRVVGLDSFVTGHKSNLEQVKHSVSKDQWDNFNFFNGDICNIENVYKALVWQSKNIKENAKTSDSVKKVDYVLHHAALGSVPRSIENPYDTNNSNVTGFLNILVASRDQRVKRVVFASSSSVYGDDCNLPKLEEQVGKPLSPYAATKKINEIYAEVFAQNYKLETVGLRYFNVFGKRQDPIGSYAAVIPKWINSMLNGDEIYIYGDGTNSRDFCYIDNVIQANILSACAENDKAINQIYNIAVGSRTDLNTLFSVIKQALKEKKIIYGKDPIYLPKRAGDINHSHADTNKASRFLDYTPQIKIKEGIDETLHYYLNKMD